VPKHSNMTYKLLIPILVTWLAQSVAGQDGQISIRSLASEMSDLSRLAYWPSRAYSSAQASSYDRASTSPRQEGWFANRDYGNYLAVERRPGRNEYVLADLKGPGTVTRIWSANPQGVIRFYFDGEDVPEMIAPMADLIAGKHPGFAIPFAGIRGAGYNLYFPIPYQKSLKITVDNSKDAKPETMYYHVSYRTYPKDTRTASFTMPHLMDANRILEKVSERLGDPSPTKSVRSKVVSMMEVLRPGQVMSWRTPAGAGEVRQLRVYLREYEPQDQGIDWPENSDLEIRNRILLEADFDGKTTISAPIGDFFATGPAFSVIESLPITSYQTTGYVDCRWIMPQRDVGRFFITNYSDTTVEIAIETMWVPVVWTNAKMYFHAKSREANFATRPFQDWTIFEANGKGRFVGLVLRVKNPVEGWWGEGDEKIYVDGETFPSVFGTGTEDYFGYAWSSTEKFQHPYHNQVRCDGPRNKGTTVVSRFHVFDDILWHRDFRFDLEIWHSQNTNVQYAATAFWYQALDGTDTFPRTVRGSNTKSD
jgi:hypothetical protein